jgi:hypothetical protein
MWCIYDDVLHWIKLCDVLGDGALFFFSPLEMATSANPLGFSQLAVVQGATYLQNFGQEKGIRGWPVSVPEKYKKH